MHLFHHSKNTSLENSEEFQDLGTECGFNSCSFTYMFNFGSLISYANIDFNMCVFVFFVKFVDVLSG
jgi:hypothetical protein